MGENLADGLGPGFRAIAHADRPGPRRRLVTLGVKLFPALCGPLAADDLDVHLVIKTGELPRGRTEPDAAVVENVITPVSAEVTVVILDRKVFEAGVDIQVMLDADHLIVGHEV